MPVQCFWLKGRDLNDDFPIVGNYASNNMQFQTTIWIQSSTKTMNIHSSWWNQEELLDPLVKTSAIKCQLPNFTDIHYNDF